MSGFQLAHPELAHLLWAVPLVLLACAWGIARRRGSLQAFGVREERLGPYVAGCTRRRWLRATVLSFSLIFVVGAVVQPRCNPKKTRFKTRARDLAVVLDVSRSMLAEDLKPNRLERAKLELCRLADNLEGDRVGLVVFAGNVVVKCPLTSNYTYFKSTVRMVSTRSASQGGTKIGDAIRAALTRLLGIRPHYRDLSKGKPAVGETQLEAEARSQPKRSYADILLITDGEDHESYPVKAAELTQAADVGLYIVGLGSEKGTPIPIRDEQGRVQYLRYKGKIVRSRLNSKVLMEMINAAPRGSFLPVGTRNFDLVSFYKTQIAPQAGREIYEVSVSWTEIFQPFLLAGILLYFLFLLIPERPPEHEALEVDFSQGGA